MRQLSRATSLCFFLSLCTTADAWSTTIRATSIPQRSRSHPLIGSDASTTTFTTALGSSLQSPDLGDVVAVPLLLVAALGLGVAAQGFINQMLEGDQGLGAFLRDGSGYNKSGMKPSMFSDNKDKAKDDPLPWLKLPELDFVEVAGQERTTRPTPTTIPTPQQQQIVIDKLETVRTLMFQALDDGNVEQAEKFKNEMEQVMADNNIEYNEFQ
ncbi:expressed unknown protein [Seminavis robusta]|uniref:Uncharacterized protein n=1 Tax=Seminavis robusta TaxID=568900 RepID=A0A9N8HY73_9STRA|nr:expressed unknown protein [Seminavis robusta]|eukprot:Sro1946_g307040.1 n/a (212) ;mRNA; r:11114-11749